MFLYLGTAKGPVSPARVSSGEEQEMPSEREQSRAGARLGRVSGAVPEIGNY